MNNIFLPIALWAALGLAGLSILVMVVSGLRSIWYGKVQPLTIGAVALPGVVALVLGGVMDTWVQAGIYTLLLLFALLILGMAATGLRQVFQNAFS